jgi:hypothetical protein
MEVKLGKNDHTEIAEADIGHAKLAGMFTTGYTTKNKMRNPS